MPASSARTRRSVAGYWVFFEGMLGWLDGSLQEIHYSDVAEQTEPQKIDTTGGWLGFTDKYWAAAIIPDQAKPVTTSFIHTKSGTRDVYQTDYLAKDALVVQPGASASAPDQLFAGAKVVQHHQRHRDQAQDPGLRLHDRLGLVLFPDQAVVLPARLAQGHRRQFRRRHPHRHRARQARGLPAGQQVLCLDEQDEEAPARDGEAQGRVSRRPDEAAAGDDGALQAREGLAACPAACPSWCRSRSSSRSTR